MQLLHNHITDIDNKSTELHEIAIMMRNCLEEFADTKKKLDRAIRVIQEVSKMSDKLSRKYGDTLVEQLDTIQAFCWEQEYILTHDEDFKSAEQIKDKEVK